MGAYFIIAGSNELTSELEGRRSGMKALTGTAELLLCPMPRFPPQYLADRKVRAPSVHRGTQ